MFSPRWISRATVLPFLPTSSRTCSTLRTGVSLTAISTSPGCTPAGVQPGDVLIAVNDTPVRSVEQVRELVGKNGKTVALLIQRGENKIFVPVQVG